MGRVLCGPGVKALTTLLTPRRSYSSACPLSRKFKCRYLAQLYSTEEKKKKNQGKNRCRGYDNNKCDRCYSRLLCNPKTSDLTAKAAEADLHIQTDFSMCRFIIFIFDENVFLISIIIRV
ncbi:hypothetical protein FKM82_025110 [Ascaphus truei]